MCGHRGRSPALQRHNGGCPAYGEPTRPGRSDEASLEDRQPGPSGISPEAGRVRARLHLDAQEAELGAPQGRPRPAHERDRGDGVHPGGGAQPPGALDRAHPRGPREGPARACATTSSAGRSTRWACRAASAAAASTGRSGPRRKALRVGRAREGPAEVFENQVPAGSLERHGRGDQGSGRRRRPGARIPEAGRSLSLRRRWRGRAQRSTRGAVCCFFGSERGRTDATSGNGTEEGGPAGPALQQRARHQVHQLHDVRGQALHLPADHVRRHQRGAGRRPRKIRSRSSRRRWTT